MITNILVVLSLLLFYAAVYCALRCAQERRLRFWIKDGVTPMSVKESVDTLPTGLCCYWPGGIVKLKNTKMDELCRACTGEALSDGEAFWKALSGGSLPGAVQGGEHPIVTLGDGMTVSFRRSEIEPEGHPLFELLADDVSEEYRMSLELDEKRRQALYINRRLRALSGEIKYVAMDREALEMKIRIHDRMGHALLMARRYLLDPDAVELDALLNEWRLGVTLLKNDGEEAWKTPYYITRKRAEALGVTLRIEGTLPEREPLLHVAEAAIDAHMTNVLRHARGKTARVEGRETADAFILTLTNDGDAPTGEIRETGGLTNLRRETEAVRGRMTIKSAPRFEMTLTLPKEVTGNGI